MLALRSRIRQNGLYRAGLLVCAVALFGTTALVGFSAISDGGGGTTARSREAADQTLPFSDSTVNWVGPAASLERLLAESDIVVIGRVTRIEGTETVYPEGYDPNDPDARAHLGGIDPGVVFTNLRLEVDEYVVGSGPSILNLRQTGDLTTTRGSREFPKPEFDKPMMLFLTREPTGNNVWASNRGPWGRLLPENGTLYYAWGDGKREVPFLSGKTLLEAAAIVRTASSP